LILELTSGAPLGVPGRVWGSLVYRVRHGPPEGGDTSPLVTIAGRIYSPW